MDRDRPEEAFEITILGGGTAGWMAANLFAHQWKNKHIKINLIESPDVPIIGVGEGSTPALKSFFTKLEIADSEWMPECNATYKANIRFEGWSPESGVKSYSHPFTTQLDVFTAKSFIVNSLTRRLGLDCQTQPEKFLLNGVLAKQGKAPIASENFPFEIEYGYHFDSHLLGDYLSRRAAQNGVNHIKANIQQVEQTENGYISSLVCDKGNKYSANLFVDCSGFSSLLMQKKLQVPFCSYKSSLFNDSAMVAATPISNNIPVETVSTALSSGWCWKIPLTNRFGNGYVYSADFISRDDAEVEFRKHLGLNDEQSEVRHLKMKVGRLEKHWFKNCLALGLSQGFIEPLEATALHLVQVSIETFISDLERGNFSEQYQSEFNANISERFERVKDYIVAHYKLNTRSDTAYWIANRENTHLSDELINILNAWFKQADLRQVIDWRSLNSHFDIVSWHCLLAGYGAFPSLSAEQPNKGDLYLEENIHSFLARCSRNFDKHNVFLN